MEDKYKLITLTDGQQVLVTESPSMKVDIGMVTSNGRVTVAKSEVMDVTEDEYQELLDQAMTKTIKVDTITQKAQAVMDIQTPQTKPVGSPVVIPNTQKGLI